MANFSVKGGGQESSFLFACICIKKLVGFTGS